MAAVVLCILVVVFQSGGVTEAVQVTALVIGVIISIFQAATQISEQTLSFVPKIVGTFLALLVCLGYILSQLSGLVTRLYGYIGQMIY